MNTIELEKLAGVTAKLENYVVKTSNRELVAKAYLQTSEGISSLSLLMAVRLLYGIESFYWEPETLWITFDKDKLDVSNYNREKIQAALGIIHNPIFFSDNLVFQRTVQAFNDVDYDAEALQECQPAHMAWAVYEASLLRGLDPDTIDIPEIDEDVQQYIAVCLKRAGFAIPPTILSCVSDNLAVMYPKDKQTFITEVKKSWSHLNKNELSGRVFTVSPLDVQLAQLSSSYLYERLKAANMSTEVLALEKDTSI